MPSYDDAVQELYQAPVGEFVTERKRLAGELKAAGDAKGAKQLLARKRPTISAWVVNQLYWHARDAFDDMLKTAERLRKGDLKASGDHREAIARLRKRASTILTDAGHAATEGTLRRVTTTLSALAVAGGFDPDPPGALAEDRDPPGFEAMGIPSTPVEREDDDKDDEDDKDDKDDKPARKKHASDDDDKPARKKHADDDDDDDKPARKKHADDDDDEADSKAALARAKAERAAREAEEEQRRREEMAEKKREEAERKRLAAERHRLEAALRTAKSDQRDRERELHQLERQVETARKAVDKAAELVEGIEAKLGELEEGN